jgi:hypothetical protein
MSVFTYPVRDTHATIAKLADGREAAKQSMPITQARTWAARVDDELWVLASQNSRICNNTQLAVAHEHESVA